LSAFLASLFDLCRFRRGPEDMPYSPRLLVALLAACGVLQVLFNLRQGASPQMLVAGILAGAAALGVIHPLLRGRGKAERFVQTAIALASVYLLFGIVADALAMGLPLKALTEQILAHPEQPPALTAGQTLLLLAIFLLGIWQLCVWVRILRRSLDVSLAGAVLVFLMLLFVDWIVVQLVMAIIGVA
jgi:hypothetical protein